MIIILQNDVQIYKKKIKLKVVQNSPIYTKIDTRKLNLIKRCLMCYNLGHFRNKYSHRVGNTRSSQQY